MIRVASKRWTKEAAALSVRANEDPRPARPTIAELREVTQPPEITNRGSAEHWTGDLYMRRISPYLTRPLLRTGISANGVTWLMITSGILSGFALMIPGLFGAVLAVVFIQLQMLLDCCDGEVSRWRRTSSALGIFLDSVGHATAEASLCIGLGVRAAGGFELSWWTVAGCFVAVIVVLNRGMNEMVGSARLKAGLPKIVDTGGAVSVSRASGVRRVKQVARLVPLHRLLHSIELSLVILIAAVVDFGFHDLAGTRVLLAILVPGTVLVAIGHLASIATSSRLK